MSDENHDVGADIDEQQAEAKLRDYVLSQYETRHEKNGIVTGKDLCQILEGLGLPNEESEVRPLLPDWSQVSAENTVEAVTTIRITHNAELALLLQRMEEGIIRLSLCDYIYYKLPFTEKDPSWAYRTVEVSLNLAPRHVLFISTGVVLLVAGIAILLLMSLLWLSQANRREEVQMENFQLLLQSFATSFEQRFVESHAQTMVDEADTLAKMIQKQHEFFVADLRAELTDDATLLAASLSAAAVAAASAVVEPMQTTLATLADIVAAGSTADQLVATVHMINAEMPQWEAVVVQRNSSTGTETTLVEARELECGFGPCEYSQMPCIAGSFTNRSTAVTVLETSIDAHRRPVTAVAVFLPSLDAVVCTTIQVAAMENARLRGMADAVTHINALSTGPLEQRREVLVAQHTNLSSTVVSWASPPLFVAGACYRNMTCTGVDSHIQAVMSSQNPSAMEAVGYHGELVMAAAAATSLPRTAVVVQMKRSGIDDIERADVITIASRMNSGATSAQEVSIGRKDPATGVINAQLTPFLHAASCIVNCERIEAASVAARRAIETNAASFVIAPNYEPRAVLAAYSYIGGGLDLAVVVEQSMETVRRNALDALVSIFNSNNAMYTGSLEAQLIAFDGMPPTRTFDIHEPCSHVRECVRDDVAGTLYRSDCVHCSREPTTVAQTMHVRSLTRLKMESQCWDIRNCSAEAIQTDGGVWRTVLEEKNADMRVVSSTDYRRERVLAVYSYIANLSVGLVLKLDAEEINGPIVEKIGVASGVAVVIVSVGLVLLIFFSRQVLDRIEHEWLSYKEQIDAEKKKFDAMVKDVLPAHVTEELRKSQKLALSLPSMSFVFLDVVGMSDRTKTWAPELVCRYVTYLFTMIDTVCVHYSLNKVRVFGDTYFAVGGLGETTTDEHCVFRCASFGSVVVQLLTPKFAHFPDTVPLIRETFEEFVTKNGPVFPDVTANPADVGHIVMPQMRVGMHYGIGTFCIIETGRTPAYEVFGPGVALAARMQVTSLGNRIHMSGAMKEILERLDKERLFDFDAMRKTVVKGQGTITSYFVKSASVNVPLEVLAALGIEHANLRVFYEEGTAGEK